MTQTRIAICLFKDDIKSFDYPEFLSGQLELIPLTKPVKDIFLYQRASKNKIPPWVDLVRSFSQIKGNDLMTASSGAILIFKTKGRFFGCCLGTSTANINRDSLVRDFGLAATFKRMIPSNTKSIESFSFSSNPITSQRTSSIPTVRNNFNIDVLGENITELQGSYRDAKKQYSIKGKEFFSCRALDSIGAIIKLAGELLLDYQNAIVQREFKRLTSTRKVKDRLILDQLDSDLCSKVQNRDQTVYLSDYENLPNIHSYRLPSDEVITDLSLEHLPNPKKKHVDVSFLKHNRITPLDENGEVLGSWSFYKSIFIEINIGKSIYILYKGNWYEIDASFLSNLRGYVDNFHLDLAPNFPIWNGKDSEENFNLKAAVTLNGQCWDKKLYKHPDYNYGIEMADILTKDQIISVKTYKSSALNSHLLLQTLVSAELLNSDLGIFDWIDEVSQANFQRTNFIGKDVATLRKRKITMLILLLSTKKKKASEILPFFSLITFKTILTHIQNLGIDVKVAVA